MRSHTVAERTRMAGPLVQYHTRIQVKNGSGTFKELTNLGGVNFFNGGSINGSIDNPVVTATFNFRKRIGADSLAPLIEASGLNRLDDGISYAPLLNSGRQIQMFTAITDPNVAPVSGDWHMIFDGKIDRVDWADRRQLSLTCRDKGAYLLDNTIIDTKRFSIGSGELVETVIQQEIDAYEGNATLVVPDPPDPAWAIKEFDQDVDVSLLEAIRTLAEQIGWTVRYEWTTGDNFELLFFEPDRAKVTEDETFGPGEYLDVPTMAFDDEGVRNDIIGWFVDSTIGRQSFRRVTHPGSILEFGRRPMVLSEEATSNIDTPEEMLRMLTAAIADLALPIADKAIRTKLFWPVQLGDLYAFTVNDDLYDSPQKFAVVAWQHEFSVSGSLRVANAHTTITLRGTPAGGYRTWLEKAGPPGEDTTGLPDAIFGELFGEGSSLGGTTKDGRVWWDLDWGPSTSYIVIWAEESDVPSVPNPDVGSTVETAWNISRPEGTETSKLGRFRTTIPMAIRPDWYGRFIGAAYNDNNQRGPLFTPAIVQAKDNVPPYVDGVLTSMAVTPTVFQDGNLVAVGVGAIDPTTESWLFIERDGFVVFRFALGTVGSRTVNFLDTGLMAGVAHTYMAYIWTKGQSGPPFGYNATGVLPADVGPRFGANSPFAVLVAGVPVLYVVWECEDPLADNIELQRSPDLITWVSIAPNQTVAAPGTVTGQWTLAGDISKVYYRLVSKSGSVYLTYTPPVYFDGTITPPGGPAASVPILSKGIRLVNGFPQLVISWTCNNGQADSVMLQQSDVGAGVWTDLFPQPSINVTQGEYIAAGFTFTAKDYRMVALKAGSVIATSSILTYDGTL